jgi:methyl coenzyme M reductase beta subunit
MDTQDPKDRRPFSTAGQKLDDVIGDAAKRIEEETKQLIAYLNDEVVPLVRENSTKGLRVASDKLKELADYMESAKAQKKE